MPVNFSNIWSVGIADGIAKSIRLHPAYRQAFEYNVADEILKSIPPELRALVTPFALQTMINYSIMMMFMPPNFMRDEGKFKTITIDEVRQYLKETKDYVPSIKIPKPLQPYILTDLPRSVKENLPVPNWTKDRVWNEFKTVPADKQVEIKEIIERNAREGRTVNQLRQEIVEKIGIPKADAQRIAEAEVRRAREWAYRQICTQLGYQKKILRAKWDACEVCKEVQGDPRNPTEYPMDEPIIPEKTHPYCRCATFALPTSNMKLPYPNPHMTEKV